MLSSCSSALPCPYLPMRCKVSFHLPFQVLVFLPTFTPRLSRSLGTNPTPRLPQGLRVWCLFLRHREERDLDSLCPTTGHLAFPSPPNSTPTDSPGSFLLSLFLPSEAQLHTLVFGLKSTSSRPEFSIRVYLGCRVFFIVHHIFFSVCLSEPMPP